MSQATKVPPWQRRLRVALWAAASILALRLGAFTIQSLDSASHGFVSYYTAGRLLLEGHDVAGFYDDASFAQQVRRFEPAVTDVHGANTPVMSLVMAPLATLDYPTARGVWAFVSYVALLALLGWLARACRLGQLATPAFIAFALTWQPVYENLLHGQFYIVGLAFAVTSFAGWRRESPACTGIPAGALLAAKSAGLPFWPMLIAARRWAALAWVAAVVMVLALASLAVAGGATWLAYARAAGELMRKASLSVTAYQTQHGLLRHLFVYDAQWNPAPLVHAPAVASSLAIVLAGTLLGVSLWLAWRRPRGELVFAAFTALALILSPVSLDYHYTLALLPVAILWGEVGGRPYSWPARLLIVAALGISTDLPYRSPRLAPGVLALLAYPKLYGAYLLWAVAVWRSVKAPPA